ncbi:hypothetical protein [Kineothrix sp. MB12-C1]|uniref:hypothetical protein n=1 Tax=Kineothrix sp. MB12-C1 TaxID=3070215 RepID=UPI0027D2C648|nr:hypothetical protein [Kineothrix sp. MB12-C1]WMC93754.1 hypothetical protein RBB56_05710 [Kineothrix sp. MB12-C1]
MITSGIIKYELIKKSFLKKNSLEKDSKKIAGVSMRTSVFCTIKAGNEEDTGGRYRSDDRKGAQHYG